jgi:hypothetical protein
VTAETVRNVSMTRASVSAPPPPPRPASAPIDYARPVFLEDQRFSQWWIWVLLLVPVAISIVTMTFFLARVSIWSRQLHALMAALALPLATPILFLAMRMNVVLTGQRLTARFFPIRRRIELADITSFRVIAYTLRDFGGWGIKWARDRSLVLSVSGNRAIRINRRSGKSLILGTQRPDEFAAVLQELGVARELD